MDEDRRSERSFIFVKFHIGEKFHICEEFHISETLFAVLMLSVYVSFIFQLSIWCNERSMIYGHFDSHCRCYVTINQSMIVGLLLRSNMMWYQSIIQRCPRVNFLRLDPLIGWPTPTHDLNKQTKYTSWPGPTRPNRNSTNSWPNPCSGPRHAGLFDPRTSLNRPIYLSTW